jgi:hypothetical protein
MHDALAEDRYLSAWIPRGLRIALLERVRREGVLACIAAAGLRFVVPWWAALLVLLVGVAAAVARALAREEKVLLPSFLSHWENAGSARKLRGDVCYVVALDGSFNPFQPTLGSEDAYQLGGNVADALVELQRGLAWLEGQAQDRGHTVAFHRLDGVLRFDELSHDDTRNRLALRLKPVIEARTRSLRSSRPHAQFFVVVLTNVPVRDFAVPSTCDVEGDEIEFCVCHVESRARTFAHEVLHLFGAQDFYPETEGSPPYVSARARLLDLARAKVPSGHLDSSIMACNTGLDDATLDVYTERAVGLVPAAGAPVTMGDFPTKPSGPFGAVEHRPSRSAAAAALNAVRIRQWPWWLALLAILVPWPAPRALLLGGALAAELVRRLVVDRVELRGSA